ncbi:imidazolonepropionase [Brumimicrobium aurantiacum]|uniref:Imidazolonepropionase n=1 Tax=Brumimicrobium aurantiacum TaxID=1737063 RepID=A0A3E1F0Y3_9FLAO|nr:imidazolonepropionase [Brumimicrobium aurantiacum]RFC55465.1 imidazolonepropionase [Brumimicrobium aurantiacum]
MAKMLIKNIKGLFQAGEDFDSFKKGEEMNNGNIIENAFLAIEDDKIIAFGSMEDWGGITDWRDLEVIDAEGKFVLPTFCDSHTHAVFAATREGEFEDRIKGLSYEEIALKGGGILNSARQLQKMDEDTLFEEALERIHNLAKYGTGAIEIKSGYGLSVEGELKMLRVIKRLKEASPMEIKATFLGAHAFPKEYKENQEGYMDLMINEMLPQISEEGLADYIDCFCERNYFTLDQMTRLMQEGAKYNLIPKVHVNQFSIMGGIKAAVDHGALSVDHLEELNDDDIEALKGSKTMPTFLPGCSFFLSIPYGKAKQVLAADLPFALASDFNPGSAPSGNMQLLTSIACTKMNLTPIETLNATTINTAYAMGISETHGTISVGKKANIMITKPISSLARIPYSFGENNIETVILNGKTFLTSS